MINNNSQSHHHDPQFFNYLAETSQKIIDGDTDAKIGESITKVHFSEIIEFAENNGPLIISDGINKVGLIPINILQWLVERIKRIDDERQTQQQFIDLQLHPEKGISMDLSVFDIDPKKAGDAKVILHEDVAKRFADLVAAAKTDPKAKETLADFKAHIREMLTGKETDENGNNIDC